MNCNIILDLLPLYEENLCREETKEFVEQHLKNCEYCRSVKASMSLNIEGLKEKSPPILDETKMLEKYYGFIIKRFVLVGFALYILLMLIGILIN